MKLFLRGLLLVLVASASVGIHDRALAARKGPCAELELSYSAQKVEPGQVFDYSQLVVNCSNKTRTIRVRIRAFGPCPFPHPSSATYRLDAHFAVQTDAVILAPACRGHYRILGKAIVRGSVTDRARAGFTVVSRR
jgi:hypothetical protein